MPCKLWFDGACTGNPGPMGIGVLLEYSGGVERISRRLPGTGTNNIAEWTAVLEGLKLAVAKGCRDVEVIGDSELVVRQWSGEYRVKAAHLAPIVEEARAVAKGLQRVEFKWVPRHANGEANDLAQGALSR